MIIRIFCALMFFMFLIITGMDILLLDEGEQLSFLLIDAPLKFSGLVISFDLFMLFLFYHGAWVNKK